MNSIDYFRKKKKLSYTDIAKKTGYSVAYINMLAKGKRNNPRMETLKKIASVLEVTIDDLVS
ncbi:helix-turn-helix transcriptional regulator [Clostridium baratii]|uniref:helix-turn-helix domain-containing protein n=1 Tax=Clostridium baratii TaxID=1561 RepID=UPI0030D12C52